MTNKKYEKPLVVVVYMKSTNILTTSESIEGLQDISFNDYPDIWW